MAEEPGSKASMMYVTQGTVQVEFCVEVCDKAQTKALAIAVRINPVQDFAVKLCKEDCIVFVKEEFLKPDNKAKQADAKVFKNAQEFLIDPVLAECSTFQQVLTHAARERTKIEIKISLPDKIQPAEDIKIKIVSIKIPATLQADTV